jgi:hypothetical protein
LYALPDKPHQVFDLLLIELIHEGRHPFAAFFDLSLQHLVSVCQRK